jgi:hypothetical protein
MPDPCRHKLRIPHRTPAGGWRWTCFDCSADLREDAGA